MNNFGVNSELKTEENILKSLDNCNKNNLFLDLENGYIYTAGSRITLYADSTRWAIASEVSGFHNRDFLSCVTIYFHGNCLINLPKDNSSQYNFITKPLIEKASFDSFLLSNKNEIKLRNTFIKLEKDKNDFFNNGIIESIDSKLDQAAITRYLDFKFPQLLRATEEEKRNCIPKDLPKIFIIDLWHHKNYFYDGHSGYGEKPSSYETFQLIAKVLVTLDTSLWKPKLQPNNHWKNFPYAGDL